MSVVAEATLPAAAVGASEALSAHPEATVELGRCVGGDGLSPYLRVETDDPAGFEAALREDPTVASVTRDQQRPGWTRYRVEWDRPGDGVLALARDHDLVAERGRASGDEWTFDLRAPDRSALRAFRAACRQRDGPLGAAVIADPPDPSGEPSGHEASERARPTASTEGAGDDQPFRQIVEHLDDVVWLTDPEKDEVIYVNPAYEDVWGHSREQLYADPLSFLDAIHPDDRAQVAMALERQPDGEYDEEYRIQRPDGTTRWVRDRAVSITDDDGTVYRVAGIAEDVTERKRRERTQHGLYNATQSILRASTSETVARVAVETAVGVLGLPLACVYVADGDELRPVAHAADGTGPETVSPVSADSHPVRESFSSEQMSTLTADEADRLPCGDEVRGGRVTPLGEYGVLLLGSRTDGDFGDPGGKYAGILAAITEAGLGKTEREARLERQNDRLTELSRLNTVIRDVNTELAAATSREGVEANVCERFAVVEEYPAACICGRSSTGGVRIRETAGAAERAFGDRDAVDAPGLDELVESTIESDAVRVARALDDSEDCGPWAGPLREADCSAVAAVPLVSGEAEYGALLLFTDDSAEFSEEYLTVLRELGQTIGRAIRAAETHKALLTDAATELEFRMTGSGTFFHGVAEEFDCRLALEGLVPAPADELIFYVTAEGVAPDRLVERSEEAAAISSVRPITETGDGGLLEFHVAGPTAIHALAAHGATIRSAWSDGGLTRIVAEVAPNTEIRPLVSTVGEVCEGIELVSKQELDRPIRTVQQVSESLGDQLTDRQLDILRSAFLSGYFEWPRESTAEDIAASFDLASSTVHFHLRNGLQGLLETFFEAQDFAED